LGFFLFLQRAGELCIIKLREEKSLKWTKVQSPKGRTNRPTNVLLSTVAQPPPAHEKQHETRGGKQQKKTAFYPFVGGENRLCLEPKENCILCFDIE
jgi:hypothetical protein